MDCLFAGGCGVEVFGGEGVGDAGGSCRSSDGKFEQENIS